ncbi:MAG: GNAT family N-acetyltransferase [Aquihabitans sp.]
MDFTIESIRSGDEAQRHDLRRQAFGPTDQFDPDLSVPSAERTVAAYVGDVLMGTVVTLDFTMTWGGSPVPGGGLSSVVVRPELRGRGTARALLRESFDRMRTRGEVVATLFPTTATLYRSVGFEVCGSHEWRRIPLGVVPTGPADALQWRRVDFDDPGLRAMSDRMATRIDGWAVTDDQWWARVQRSMAMETSKNRFAYLGARDGIDAAALIYRYEPSTDHLYELATDLVAGVDEAAVAGALGFLATNGTTASEVETTLPASLLARHVPSMQRAKVTNDWPWMLRLVDVAGAIATRGWPSTVTGRVELDIVDETIPANAGPHVFEIADGAASLERGGSGAATVTVNDLAVIYAGGDVRGLAEANHLVGATRTDIDLLATAFVSHPSMSFFF